MYPASLKNAPALLPIVLSHGTLRTRSSFLATAKILIVDDNPSDTNVLCASLRALDKDLEIEIVSDGPGALEFVRSRRESCHDVCPCVFVLDLHLPGLDGLEVLRAIRRAPALTHIKVIVLTGVASRTEVNELQRMGAIYRTKPMDLCGFEGLAADLIALCHGLQAAA